MDYHKGYFSERIRKLAEHGLVQQVSPRGVYRLTDRGRDYLSGEYDAREESDIEKHETDGGTTVTA